MRKNNQYYIRKIHRWLGVIIGIQFILWTGSGLYFSWTDIDEIHGDHFLKPAEAYTMDPGTFTIRDSSLRITNLALRFVDNQAYLWVNDSLLIEPNTGTIKPGINQNEAERIAKKHVKDKYKITATELLKEAGPHHEYRGRALPVWAVHFDGGDHLTAYITQRDGSFQRVRHRSWRWFDFLWMVHTMDYQGRDNINNFLLRTFSLLGLFTIASGFTLFFVTRKMKRRKK